MPVEGPVELEAVILAHPEAIVTEQEGVIGDRRRVDHHVVDGQRLLKILVVHPEGEVVEHAGVAGGQLGDEASAIDLAVAGRSAAAEGRDVAVLTDGLRHEGEPLHARYWGEVVTGVDEGIVGVLRRDLECRADGVAVLPEIVVAQRGVEAQRRGVGAVAVVQLHAAVEGKGIFHHQLHVNRARHGAGLEFRCDPQIGAPVEADNVLFHVAEVRDGPLGEGWGQTFDPFDVVVFRSPHGEPPNGHFLHAEDNDPAGRILRRDLDDHRLVAGTMVSLLERGAGQFDILRRALRAEISIDGIIDLVARQVARSDHAVFANVERRRRQVGGRVFTLRVGGRHSPRGLAGRGQKRGQARREKAGAERHKACRFDWRGHEPFRIGRECLRRTAAECELSVTWTISDRVKGQPKRPVM